MIKKIFKVCTSCLIIILFMLLIVLFSLNIQRMYKPNQVPSLFGLSQLEVITGSMKPVLIPGDLIIVKEINSNKLKKGDIITYRINDLLITHRIKEVINEDNDLKFITQGDDNNIVDSFNITNENLVGIYIFKIPQGATIIHTIMSIYGIITLCLTCSVFLLIKKLLKELKKRKHTVKIKL